MSTVITIDAGIFSMDRADNIERKDGNIEMSVTGMPAVREIAQLAKNEGILNSIPENDDVLVFVVYELLLHVIKESIAEQKRKECANLHEKEGDI